MRTAIQSLLLLSTLFIAACGGGGGDDNTQPPEEENPLGSLAITVSGLPAEVTSDITVSGPEDYNQAVTGSVTLSDLAPGSYTIQARSVTVAEDSFSVSPDSQSVTVSADQQTNATVTYALELSESDVFPVGLAVAAPTDIAATNGGSAPAAFTTNSSSTWTTAYASAVNRINALLDGTVPVNDAFTPDLFFNSGVNANCYGPSLMYEDHPDAASPNSGQLPGGDLMMWVETDPMTGHTCSAAQLNARLNGVKNQSFAALMGMASMLYVAIESEYSEPEVGDTVDLTDEMNDLSVADVTFDAVSITHVADNEWSYSQDYTFTFDGVAREISVAMTHEGSDTEFTYAGLLQYSINGDDSIFGGGNCAETDRTLAGSLAYERAGETAMQIQSRTAILCGADASGFVADATADDAGQVDPDNAYNATTAPNGWSENFNVFGMDMDPTTLEGSYAYGWQAGVNDSHSRIFLMGVNYHETGGTSSIDGEAYAGFGATINSTDGTIMGMICNWAGPDGSHTLQPYGQRQFFSLNETTNVFETPTGGSDITYAPTNSCEYDGSGSFVYDTDLDGDLSDETASGAISADLMDASDTDSDGTATMAEAIEARGYTLPVIPGGFPGS